MIKNVFLLFNFFCQNRVSGFGVFYKIFYNRVTSCGERRFQMSSVSFAPDLTSSAAPSPIEAGISGGGGGVIGGDCGRGSVAVREP